jgi:hypothetical protein
VMSRSDMIPKAKRTNAIASMNIPFVCDIHSLTLLVIIIKKTRTPAVITVFHF